MQKNYKDKQQIPDGSSFHLQTFQLVPPKQEHLSWVSSLKKSGKLSNASSIKIFIEEDSLNHSKRFLHSQPVDSIRNTELNLSQIIRKSAVTCKHILKSDYQKLIEEYSLKNTKFTDPQFPPVQKSIGNSLPIYQWKRISQIIQNPQFVRQLIQPSDVLQGQIGDCYFLSAVAALAQNDYRIKNIFPSLEIQPNGIYMARILHQGILRQVVVDQYIPVKQNGIPVFAKPSGGKQIWVIILQKCWAKLYGSYQAIIGGMPHQVLHAFSGAPTFYHAIPLQNDKKLQDELFDRIFKSYQDGDILCCGTKPLEHIQEKGLVRGHAYTILGIYKTPCKLLKLRNPWGKKQWNGRASEKDSIFWSVLSEGFKQMVGYHDSQSHTSTNGIFFMLWQDFIEMFEMVDVCRIRDNASYFCLPSFLNYKNGKLFQFQLTEPAQLTVALSQRSLRGANKYQIKKGYSKSTIIMAKCSKINHQNEYKFIKCSQNLSFSDHYLDCRILTEGHYVFFIKADWIDRDQQKTVVSVYTEAKILVKQTTKQQHKDFLFKVFLNHARRNTQRRQIISQKPLQWICSDFLANHGSYGYSAYHIDPSSNHKFCIQFDQKQFNKQNLVLKKPYKNNGKIKTLLKPGQDLIILFRLKAYHYTQKLTIPIPKVYKF